MKNFGILTMIASTIALLSLLVFVESNQIEFLQNCKGHLKHAADADTVELAKNELGKSLRYIEAEGLTSGSTHAFYQTPSCDLGFWYTNLKSAESELDALPEDATPLVVSNHLIKLRGTLVDQREKGPKVTVPPNISFYPYQSEVRLTTAFSLIGLFAGFIAMAAGCENSQGKKCKTEQIN